MNNYDPTNDLRFDEQPDSDDSVWCSVCGGTGLAPEGWDCEECDGLGYWEI